jgi:hypothetical protein
MQRLTEYICEILNIKADNELVVADIQSKIALVNDVAAYTDYVRSEFNKDAYEFMTGFQKFISITDKYLKIQEDKILEPQYEKAEKYAKHLSAKVKHCREFVRDNSVGFENIAAEGEKFFKDHELRMLERIGSVTVVIHVSGLNRLAGEIYKEYVKSLRERYSSRDKQLPMPEDSHNDKNENLTAKRKAMSKITTSVKRF